MTHRVRMLTKLIGGKAPAGLVYGAAPALMVAHSLTAPVFPWSGWGVLAGVMGLAMISGRQGGFAQGFVEVIERIGKGGRHRSK